MKSEHAIVDSATRRSFLVGLAAAATLPALPAAALAQAPAASPAAGTAEAAEIDALMAIVSLRYGSYIKSDELPLVRRSIERQYASVAMLRKTPIHNEDDAPDILFIPDGR